MNANNIPPITEDDIANYLANTPDFFERHASLLAAVQLTSPHGHRAVSLQERQAEMLREKIRGLELKGAEMIRYGQREHRAIADKLQRWTRELLLTREARELPAVAVRRDHRTFSGASGRHSSVWDVAPEFADEPFAQGASDDVKAFAVLAHAALLRWQPRPGSRAVAGQSGLGGHVAGAHSVARHAWRRTPSA